MKYASNQPTCCICNTKIGLSPENTAHLKALLLEDCLSSVMERPPILQCFDWQHEDFQSVGQAPIQSGECRQITVAGSDTLQVIVSLDVHIF